MRTLNGNVLRTVRGTDKYRQRATESFAAPQLHVWRFFPSVVFHLCRAHWFYLRVLAQHGEINQLELSKRVGMASASAVPALDNMEKRGLLKRRRDPKDRRKYYVGLTDKGRRLVDRLLPQIGAMISDTLDGITHEEMRIFWKVAHHIANNLAAMAKDDGVLD
jgi:DNA-binding MarR family transcriptional regulator